MFESGYTTQTYYVRVYSPDYASGYYYVIDLDGTSTSSLESKFYLKDHLGSIRAIVDDAGNHEESFDYYPFGLEMPGRSSNSANPADNYKFTGHEFDEEAGLDMYHMNARTMDPVTGRFLQIDPLHDQGGQNGWTPYHYTLNNPLNRIDPTGLLSTHTDEEWNDHINN